MVKKMCAKRFTDSKKWDDPWFTDLPNKYKLMWFYMLDKCDHAGFFKVNKKMMEFCIGDEIKIDEALSLFNGRIQVVNPEKWFLPKFVTFQYGQLKTDSKVHTSVLATLLKEGVSTECGNSGVTPKDKDKDKDKDKAKEKEREKEERCAHFKSVDFKKTYQDYLDMRIKIRKPATEEAERLVLKQLNRHDIKTAIAMLEKSIVNSWTGVFDLKEPLKRDMPPL